jgi:hypothetical protein
VNDRQVGVTSGEAGQLEAEMIAGSHRVEVRAEGYGTFRGEVTVGPDEGTLLEVELEERPLALQSPPATESPGERVVYRSPLTWPTYTTLGVGAASAAVAIFAFVRVGNLRSDREVRQWNDEGTFREACASARARAQTEADAQPAVRRCDQEARLSPLRWVFLALGLAASGTGAYLLWRDLSRGGGDADGVASTRLRLDADVDRHGGHIRTTWRF